MEKVTYDHMYLCGCVFFFLLLQAVKPNETARSHRAGGHDKHSDSIVMKDLIYTFTGRNDFGTVKDTSQYKEGKTEGTVNLPFNDGAIINAFKALISKNHLLTLSRMKKFVSEHLNRDVSEWLVGAILDIISCDDTIANNCPFYVKSDGNELSKSQLLETNKFELEPFLVGILLFILTERRGKNQNGKATLNLLGEKKARKPRNFESKVGQSRAENIIVTEWHGDAHLVKEKTRQNKKASTEDSMEANVIKMQSQDSQNDNSKGEKKQTMINHQTNIVQNGDHNVNITNNGTMNLNL